MITAFEYLLANLARLDERVRETGELADGYDPAFGQRRNALEDSLLDAFSRQLRIKMKRRSQEL